VAEKLIIREFEDRTQAGGAFTISLPTQHDLAQHQLAVTVSAIPSAGTLNVQGVPPEGDMRGRINAELDSIDLTQGGQFFQFSGFYRELICTPSGFDADKFFDVHLASRAGNLILKGPQGIEGVAGSDGVLAGFAEPIVANGAAGASLNLNYAAANVQSLTLNANLTLSVSNVPAGWCRMTLIVTQDAVTPYTITWPTGTDWGSYGVPDLSTLGKESIVILTTRDGGTKWAGLLPFTQGDL
jgi:hypothetical protein